MLQNWQTAKSQPKTSDYLSESYLKFVKIKLPFQFHADEDAGLNRLESVK